MFMVVNIKKYSKDFISQTEKEDVSEQESQVWKNYQVTNQEDKEIRREIKEKFGFHCNSDNEGEGFDGQILYYYQIKDNLGLLKEGSTNIQYQTAVFIKRALAINDLLLWSDLERFLISKKFKELK